MKLFPFSISATRFLLVLASLLSLVLVACGDEGGSSNTGGTGGFPTVEAACGRCFNSTPIGPNESESSCAALGALFDCESAEIQGECPSRLCVVTNCSIQVDCNAELP
jgi:hypothetical protein